MSTQTFRSSADLAQAIAELLAQRIGSIQSQGRRPRLVLTGGTIAVAAYQRLAPTGADWTDVDYYWGDERFVPAGHSDRNDHQAREAFLDRFDVPDERIHAMPAHGCDVSMAEAADRYAASLPAEPFDIVLLGVGPDAHIASLFPGFAQLHETQRLVVEVFGSPKPPPERITLTYPALNNAYATWFIVSGVEKADAVARAQRGAAIDEAPAAGAHGIEETLWLLDDDAASAL